MSKQKASYQILNAFAFSLIVRPPTTLTTTSKASSLTPQPTTHAAIMYYRLVDSWSLKLIMAPQSVALKLNAV